MSDKPIDEKPLKCLKCGQVLGVVKGNSSRIRQLHVTNVVLTGGEFPIARVQAVVCPCYVSNALYHFSSS
jgi:hypothetical protein